MNDWAKWALGVFGALLVLSIGAVARILSGKANKSDLVKPEDIVTVPELAKAIEGFDSDIKLTNARIDTFVALFGQAVSKTDLIKDMGAAAMRANDNDLRVQKDLAELKADLKTLSEKVTLVDKTVTEKVTVVDKKLDELPARVASLELSRTQK